MLSDNVCNNYTSVTKGRIGLGDWVGSESGLSLELEAISTLSTSTSTLQNNGIIVTRTISEQGINIMFQSNQCFH